MRIYGSDWLTNASLVGYLRIQQNSGINPKVKDGYIEIKEEDLKHFTDAYFVSVLEQYMQNSFVINKKHREQLAPADRNNLSQFHSKIDEFIRKQESQDSPDYSSYKKSAKKYASSLVRYKTSLKKFLAQLQKEFGIKQKTIDSVLNASNKKIDDKIDAISGSSQKFLPNALQRFYFNKAIVGNYSISKKTTRYDEFKANFVASAINVIKKPLNYGHLTCKVCKQNKVCIKSFDENLLNEAMFSSTMVSDRKFSNFFYNGQSDLFICGVCELLLLCSWAGFNPIPLAARDDISETDYMFLNLADIAMSLKHNDQIRKSSERNSYRYKDTIYSQTIQKILADRQKNKSKWLFENMFFVEIKTVSRKDSGKPDFRYYDIEKNIAELFSDDIITTSLSNIHATISYKGEKKNLVTHIIECMLSGKPLYGTMHQVSVFAIAKNAKRSWELFNICLISAVRNVINLRYGEDKVSTQHLESKTVFGSLRGMQENGKSLAKKINNTKKTKSYSFVLLEAVRNNNIAKFYDMISKLYITNNMPIPDGMVGILNKSDTIGPHERAYAFLSGFVSTGAKSDD